MGPSCSDIDETMGPILSYDDLSDCYHENASEKHREIETKEESTNERQIWPCDFDSNSRIHPSYPSEPNHNKTDLVSMRQRRMSDISDVSYPENEGKDPQEHLDSSGDTRLSGGESEVENHRTTSGVVSTLKLSLPPKNSCEGSESVARRKTRPWNHRSTSSSGFSDVDETAKYTSKNEHTKVRKTKQRKRRSLQTSPTFGQTSTDCGISTSDVDESRCILKGHNPFENSEVDEEALEATNAPIARESNDAESHPEEVQFVDVVEAKACDVCSDIDAKINRCKLCQHTLCKICTEQHFDMHAAEVTTRLVNLNELALSLKNDLPFNRMMAKIDDAIDELIAAGNKALERAFNVYQVSSAECTSFIGSLVDRRIKISASIKYLIQQIPTVLHSEDLCELLHFKKVFKGVQEKLDELAISTSDPKAKEMERLTITSTFSPTGPLLGPNNLILALGNFDFYQGQSEPQSRSGLFSKPGTTMHFEVSSEHRFED